MDILQALQNRRSIRFFDPEREIDQMILDEMIELASLAPSAMNMQPWEVVAVTSAEMKQRLYEISYKQEKVREASAVLVVVANPMAVEENAPAVFGRMVELGLIPADKLEEKMKSASSWFQPPDSEKRRLFAVKCTGLFAMNLMIAAQGMDIDTHPMDGFDEPAVKKLLEIDERKIVPLFVCAGYRRLDAELQERGYRRPLASYVRYI